MNYDAICNFPYLSSNYTTFGYTIYIYLYSNFYITKIILNSLKHNNIYKDYDFFQNNKFS